MTFFYNIIISAKYWQHLIRHTVNHLSVCCHQFSDLTKKYKIKAFTLYASHLLLQSSGTEETAQIFHTHIQEETQPATDGAVRLW